MSVSSDRLDLLVQELGRKPHLHKASVLLLGRWGRAEAFVFAVSIALGSKFS